MRHIPSEDRGTDAPRSPDLVFDMSTSRKTAGCGSYLMARGHDPNSQSSGHVPLHNVMAASPRSGDCVRRGGAAPTPHATGGHPRQRDARSVCRARPSLVGVVTSRMLRLVVGGRLSPAHAGDRCAIAPRRGHDANGVVRAEHIIDTSLPYCPTALLPYCPLTSPRNSARRRPLFFIEGGAHLVCCSTELTCRRSSDLHPLRGKPR